jgi:hypothetical protein
MVVILTGFVTLGSWILGEAQQRVLTNSTLFIYIYIYIYIYIGLYIKVKQSLYTPWRRLGGEEV